MIRILINGCNGRMGKSITNFASKHSLFEVVGGIDINNDVQTDFPFFTNINECNIEADVLIDFSRPNALNGVLEYAVSKNLPLIVATTGLDDVHNSLIRSAAKQIPVFRSVNLSIGINLMLELVKKAASALGDDFDIEIIEKHHNKKIDAPSGTSLLIAENIKSVLEETPEYVYDRHTKYATRTKNEIGIHCVRAGTITGEHDAIFAGEDEILEIKHTSLSPNVFVQGAIKAMKFIVGKEPGLYGMSDIL